MQFILIESIQYDFGIVYYLYQPLTKLSSRNVLEIREQGIEREGKKCSAIN